MPEIAPRQPRTGNALKPLVYTRNGRSPQTILALAGVYGALAAAIVWLDAAPWIIAAIVVTTLPAIRDLVTNRSAGLRLTDTRLEWHSGTQTGAARLEAIDHVRFDRGWDFSMRVTLVPRTGAKVRIRPESLPPHQILEAALSERGVRIERHPFSILSVDPRR